MSKFITNNGTTVSVADRVNTLISISHELKFLVGFFYFSGWSEIAESLRQNEESYLKILVGLDTFNYMGTVVEYGLNHEGASQNEQFHAFLNSTKIALNQDTLDTQEFYEQIKFFVAMIENGRLEIRKTENPNHAKLYLFHLKESQKHLQGITGEFITGSSNLTKAGFSGQQEFNVEIRDYGYETAENYFDDLWEYALPITDNAEYKKQLIDLINTNTLVADVSPFEAYCLVLKTYLDLYDQTDTNLNLGDLLEKLGFKKFSYQLDAVQQALRIINEHNGCIIADVVGLGKSIISSLIAKQLNQRGLIICPPGLMGNPGYRNSGWWEYLERFGLYNWHVFSRGALDKIGEQIEGKGYEIVIIDEAHYFRNENTQDYEYLSSICRGKKVILLTATPFNNSPADIFALLKLFIIPGKSSLSLDDDLESQFRSFGYTYDQLSTILKDYQSDDNRKKEKAERIYTQRIGLLPVQIKRVHDEIKQLSENIKHLISPIVIRRNRLDLQADYIYSKEIDELSKVRDPEEVFYYLTESQNHFYDAILSTYFGPRGMFTGAIYTPFLYQEKFDLDKLDKEENMKYQNQTNLFEFMRRLLVKRFESSFGSFEKSIERFLEVHRMVRHFISKTRRFILDRKYLEKFKDDSLDDIETFFENYIAINADNEKAEVYVIDELVEKDRFLANIDSDIQMFENIQRQLKELDLTANDPKQEAIIEKVRELLEQEPARKIIIFSEYVDTVQYLEIGFKKNFGDKVLICDGKMTNDLGKWLNTDFNAQFQGEKTNQFQILITSDKLAEGFNLNRAGVVINYDIPWNPTKVIQRLGRINRIGAKVFDELYLFNFFPSLKGSSVVRSKEIAGKKMFLIHNALGEDTKIFTEDEKPTASNFVDRINARPEEEGEISIGTKIRNLYRDITQQHPDIIKKIEQYPTRIKTAKSYDSYSLNILRKKGDNIFAQIITKQQDKTVVEDVPIELFLHNLECSLEEPKVKFSMNFWGLYEEIKEGKIKFRNNKGASDISSEEKALDVISIFRKKLLEVRPDLVPFADTLKIDIREYKTLPKYSLKQIAKVGNKLDDKKFYLYIEELERLQKLLGSNYLNDLQRKVGNRSKEVIIAVENVKQGVIL
ncbi:helicase-related protein [Pelistega sp. MC2]|uniref:helicase-related protein n=1 Tax=Pelistega sp. MC2 TaxID=1720297 RepID=UPI0008DABEDA|nr:helicase-related protein [Pelistega sp. MC2]